MTTENKMTVEIWSDVACPFCYLGKKRFSEALAQFEGRDEVEVLWKSFQLSPDLATDPDLHINDYLAREKGIDLEHAQLMNAQIAEAGRQEGVTFDFEKVVVANTYDAHRLLQFAKANGRQIEAAEALFRAYFEQGRNLADRETLLAIAEEAGLQRDALAAALETDAYGAEVGADVYEAQQLDIRGVPFFVFNRKYAVAGAQPAALFFQALGQSHGEWNGTIPEQAHGCCGGGGCGSGAESQAEGEGCCGGGGGCACNGGGEGEGHGCGGGCSH